MAESADIAVLDGEDAGTTPWEFDSITEEAGNGFDLDAAAHLHGNFGYKANMGGTNTAVYGKKAFAEQTDIYIRFYIKFLNWNFTNNNKMTYWRPLWDGGHDLILLYLKWHSATNDFGYYIYIEDDSGTNVKIDKGADSIFSQGTKYRLEFRYKSHAVTGGYQFWIDGDSKGSDFTLATSSLKPDSIYLGPVGGNEAPNSGIAYLDDILISTSAIGAYTYSYNTEKVVFTSRAPSVTFTGG